MDLGLERIEALLCSLGNPQDEFKVIHVAGTNGKGSVCAYIASVLQVTGVTVGRFNSPHFLEPRDSIDINGAAVSEQVYEDACARVRSVNEQYQHGASNFELLVASALLLFREHNVEWIVMEVGLGGTLDATNVFCQPQMTIITAIGWDHAAILGGSIAAIAAAKAGIMKSNCPAVIAPQESEEALGVLKSVATEVGAPYQLAPSAAWVPGRTIVYPVPLRGDFQRANSATAVIALMWLRERGELAFSDAQLQQGMATTRWPGRLDEVHAPVLKKGNRPLPTVLVDGAHNPPAVSALSHYVRDAEQDRPVTWIVGITQGKEIDEMLSTLLRSQDTLLAVPFSQPKDMPWIHCIDPQEIRDHAAKIVSDARAFDTLDDALLALPSAPAPQIVLCGSLYLVADFYRLLK
ncbi:Mur ligase [Dichotomocladium elegans]|nr:Mur ligase [Dichotomocladium elegans]